MFCLSGGMLGKRHQLGGGYVPLFAGVPKNFFRKRHDPGNQTKRAFQISQKQKKGTTPTWRRPSGVQVATIGRITPPIYLYRLLDFATKNQKRAWVEYLKER